MKKIGFIGAGNMATAMIKGMVNSQTVLPHNIVAFDTNQHKCADLQQTLGTGCADSVAALIGQVDIVILAVKPNVLLPVLKQNSAALQPQQLLVSIAAGISLEQMMHCCTAATKIVRVIPNTPALVGEGMTALTANEFVTESELAQVQALFDCLGRVMRLPEDKMHTVTGVSGSSPAYAFMFIDALADAGVAGGLTKAQSLELAAQTLLGAAKMVLETGEHPVVLKDQVCSPGGTTIAAVKTLEDKGFRSAVINGALAAMEKSRQLG